MDYEKKYKEALERAKSFKTPELRDVAEYIFHELKESEDEKTRKRIIALVNAHGQGRFKVSMLAWLEKQGEQETWSEKDKKEYKYVLKFVDNILNNCGNKKDYEHCKRCYDWLKSIKQRIKKEVV